MAGATTTRSACLAEAHVRDLVDVVPDLGRSTGWPDSAAQVGAPTKLQRGPGGDDADVVAALGQQPEQLDGLVRGDARRRRRGRPACGGGTSGCEVPIGRQAAWSGLLDGLGGQQAGVDLAQRDRQRLLVHVGLDERADVLEQALAELASSRR